MHKSISITNISLPFPTDCTEDVRGSGTCLGDFRIDVVAINREDASPPEGVLNTADPKEFYNAIASKVQALKARTLDELARLCLVEVFAYPTQFITARVAVRLERVKGGEVLEVVRELDSFELRTFNRLTSAL